jgi:hypothetical protein
MDLTVEVRDAAYAVIAGAGVVCTAAGGTIQGSSDARGRFVISPMPAEAFTVEASHGSYLSEQVEVSSSASGGARTWDNPVCTLTPSALVVRLSRLRAAPTTAVSNADLEKKSPYNPQSAFTWIDNNGNPTGRYLAMFNDPRSVFTAASPLLPEKPGDGWGRLNHDKEPAQIDPSRSGDLVWLEWGLGQTEPRLAVAAWLPRFRGATPSTLDVVIVFSPNTQTKDRAYPADAFPWLHDYPYAATKRNAPPGSPPLPLVQPYLGLAHRYLFLERWLLYQLAAAGKQAVVVFPLQPYGDWGPFGKAAGLARLLAEVTHFMHRTGHTSGGQASRDLDHALVPRYRVSRAGYHAPPPPLRRVVVSGVSAGMSGVTKLLTTQIGDKLSYKGLTHALFGADVAPFLRVWQEVWDLDASYKVRPPMDSALAYWMDQDSARMARCYQTHDTYSKGWIDTSSLLRYTSGPKLLAPAGLPEAAERHSGRCSLVYFGHGYLHHKSTDTATPAFWRTRDDHAAVSLIGFGHAARLSGLAQA